MTNRPNRIPPGQKVIQDFPVLHIGPIPEFDPEIWDFRVFGLVEGNTRFTYDEFINLPKSLVRADFHCVEGWSILDCLWEGVRFLDLMPKIRLKPQAKYVMVHCEYSYTVNVALEDLMSEDVLFAWRLNGKDLTPEHGYPLRLVVPKLYAWKSAKWVRGLEFMAENKPGYWEERGYHLHGDPWKEERRG